MAPVWSDIGDYALGVAVKMERSNLMDLGHKRRRRANWEDPWREIQQFMFLRTRASPGFLSFMVLHVHRDRAQDGHLDFHTVQCCFTSTETVGTIRDGEPRTITSTFTQPLSSASPVPPEGFLFAYILTFRISTFPGRQIMMWGLMSSDVGLTY